MAKAGDAIGTVAEIWRYPVQSMRGESLADTEMGADGVVGDRAYGIVDPQSGAVVSSARGRRQWRGIVTLAARYRDRTPPHGTAVPIDIRCRQCLSVKRRIRISSDYPKIARNPQLQPAPLPVAATRW